MSDFDLADKITEECYKRVASGNASEMDKIYCVLDANYKRTQKLLNEILERQPQINGRRNIKDVVRANASPVIAGGGIVAIIIAILEKF